MVEGDEQPRQNIKTEDKTLERLSETLCNEMVAASEQTAQTTARSYCASTTVEEFYLEQARRAPVHTTGTLSEE